MANAYVYDNSKRDPSQRWVCRETTQFHRWPLVSVAEFMEARDPTVPPPLLSGSATWFRWETDEEWQARMNFDRNRDMTRERWERETYKKLRAKFEGVITDD